MAFANVSASLYLSIPDACATRLAGTSAIPRLSLRNSARFGTAFATGSPVFRWKSTYQRKHACKATPVSIRCEQSSNDGNGLDTWLGRFAMVGFAAAISVEVATGKGLLENFGLTSPLPTVALGVTALVGVLTAIFIFQSGGSEN